MIFYFFGMIGWFDSYFRPIESAVDLKLGIYRCFFVTCELGRTFSLRFVNYTDLLNLFYIIIKK